MGKPCWEWDINSTGKLLLTAISAAGLGVYGLVISSIYLPGNTDITMEAINSLLCSLSKIFLIFSIVPGILTMCGVAANEAPTFGGLRYIYYKCNLNMDEKGMTIQLADDWDSDLFQYSWSCPWEEMVDVQFTQNTKIFTDYVMTAKGNATVLDINANPAVKPMSPSQQRKIFGGNNTVIVHLGSDMTDVQSVLENVKKH